MSHGVREVEEGHPARPLEGPRRALAGSGRAQRLARGASPNDRTKAQAEEYAREREKHADRIAKGLENEPERTEFGAMCDQWWNREGRRRRGSSTEDYLAFLVKHLAPLRSFVLTPATGGAFAEKLDVLLDEKEDRGELGRRA